MAGTDATVRVNTDVLRGEMAALGGKEESPDTPSEAWAREYEKEKRKTLEQIRVGTRRVVGNPTGEYGRDSDAVSVCVCGEVAVDSRLHARGQYIYTAL